MAVNVLPYEVKRLIYDHVDLETIKSLRQVSTSWATVGLDLLFLPCFVVQSYSVDLLRLKNIGASQNASHHAASVIKTLKFHSLDWNAQYLRSIVCSRHSHLSNYEVVDFVPTQQEQEALDELDSIIKRRALDDIEEHEVESMIHAFRQVPQVTSIQVTCPNAFKNRLLRKVWDEYNMETLRSQQLHQGSRQLVNILSAAKQAGLNIQHISDDQLTSYFFTGEEDLISPDIYAYLGNLKSVNFTISDVPLEFLPSNIACERLRKLLSASPCLESICIKFEALFPISLDILPNSQPCPTQLKSLILSGFSMDTTRFFAFLSMQAKTLRNLTLNSAEMAEGSGTWKDFLLWMKEGYGSTLEKFQLCGVLRPENAGGETWLLSPIYKMDWSSLPTTGYHGLSSGSHKTKDVEAFVLRAGEYPMTDADDISGQLD